MSSTNARAVEPDWELEACVIGALILGGSSRSEALLKLTPEMFADAKLRTQYLAIKRMVEMGAAVDIETVRNDLQAHGQLEDAGGVNLIATCAEGVPRTDAACDYADRLAALTAKRRVIHALTKTAGDIGSGEMPTVDAGAIYDRIIKAAGLAPTEKMLIPMRELLKHFDPHARMQGTATDRFAPSSGLLDLDQAVSLFSPFNFTVIAARPGVGKSTLMRQMAYAVADRGPVVVFSLEESNEEVRDKLACMLADVDYTRFTGHALNEDECERLLHSAAAIYERDIRVYGGYDCDASRVTLVLRALHEAGEKPVAVFVDHLQRMRHPRAENRDAAVGETTRILRLASLEFGAPIVLLCQMNRAQDNRNGDDKRPRLSDLRESGNIEADAKNVVFLWRPPEGENVITVTVAKHRDGPTSEFNIVHLKAAGRFASMAVTARET